LWQPIVNGQQFLTQFLRLRVANEMIADGVAKTSTQDLRDTLAAGAALEIAGYDLAPELAHAIDRLKLAEIAPGDVPAYWFEVGPEADGPLSPASRRVADGWIARDVDVRVRTVAGEPFWNTIEIAECPELLAQTTRTVAESVI
jgi:exosortase A-associated hydrolase 2